MTFNAGPGNYVFAQETQPGRWKPICIGETSNLSERFDSHHKSSCIEQRGFNPLLGRKVVTACGN